MAIQTDNEFRELAPEQGNQLLDDKAKQYLGLTGEEFRAQWDAGQLDPDADPNMRVAMLLPLAG